ncbi:hypothetical protein [Catellatospora sp. NPDC049133]|uniref:hypothetical protein n=1 Tax=Catellatospora sp. NPDC049133 TaxID=3155499 RepID=UPI0033CECABA
MSVDRDPREPADLPQDWWFTHHVLRYLEAVGIKIKRGTWSTYTSRGYAPKAKDEEKLGQLPRWRPDVIREYARTRPGQGARNTKRRSTSAEQ